MFRLESKMWSMVLRRAQPQYASAARHGRHTSLLNMLSPLGTVLRESPRSDSATRIDNELTSMPCRIEVAIAKDLTN